MTTKEDTEGFENSTKCWICGNSYVDVDVKLSDHCHTTEKYRDSANKYRNINDNPKRNINDNPPPCGFSKTVFSREGLKPCFL